MKWQTTHKRRLSLVLLVLVISLLLTLIANQDNSSVGAYCNQYNKEKAKIDALDNGVFPSELFQTQVNDVRELKDSYSALERMAPGNVNKELNSMVIIYEDLESDPTKLLDASMAAGDIDKKVYRWTLENCSL